MFIKEIMKLTYYLFINKRIKKKYEYIKGEESFAFRNEMK